MKMKSLIATIGLALTLSAGALVGLNKVNHGEVKEAEAATLTANTKIWFNTGGSATGGWGDSNATLYAWTWYDGYSKMHKLNWDSTAAKYSITLEGSSSGFTLCRAGSDWQVDGSTSWPGDGIGAWGKQNVNFGTTSQNMLDVTSTNTGVAPTSWSEYKVQSSGATIYVKTGGQTSGWAADNAKISAWCWKTSGSQWAAATWDSTSGFYKFTLPGNSTGFTLYRGSASQSGTTFGPTGTQYNTADVHLDSKKTLLDATAVPGTLSWGYYCDSYIYYVNDDNNETDHYIYTWGSSQYFGTWPGTQIKNIGGVSTVEGDIQFNGSTNKKIYKIPYSSFAGETGVKFRGGSDDYQTDDFTLTSGSAYKWDTTSQGSAYYTAMGAAIELLLEEETARKAATSQSICNISVSKCSSLYTKYSTIGSTAQGLINNSKTLTYPSVSTSDAKVYVSFEDIFYQIGLRGGNISRSAVLGVVLNTNENAAATIIIVISTLSITSLGLFLFLKKRKESR